MIINSINDAEKVLLKYVPAVKAFTGKDITIERIKPILSKLDNPQDKIKIVHIAGTSGKTSTSYYIADLLQKSGMSVGLTVSPHIDKVTERIQLNGKPIKDELFCTYLAECIDKIKDLPVQPSYFELLIALAFWVFYKEGVDYAVIETGMGGLHDSSNVTTRADKVCVITDIGFDHMHILGDTISKISYQKAGIIQVKNTVFMYEQSKEVMQVIQDKVKAVDAKLFTVNNLDMLDLNLNHLADFQKRNFILAYKTVSYILQLQSSFILQKADVITSSHTYIPARMDVFNIKDKVLIMDGAHNGQKSHNFVKSFKNMFPNQKATVMIALKDGKEYAEVLKELKDITSSLIVTKFNTSQDLPAHSIDPTIIRDSAIKMGYASVSVIDDNKLAYNELLSKKDDLLVITGSFYLLSQVRKNQQLQHAY
ncbi:MAG: Mur ligase family protein [bacterium]